MKVVINEQEITIPSLEQFNLRQRITFQLEVGNLLDEMLKSIGEMEDEEEQELEYAQFHFERMFRTFAWFINSTPEALRESEFINQVSNIYYGAIAPLFKEEISELQREFIWNNETWVLPEPELNNGDKTAFGEIIDSKQMVQDMIKMGKTKWEYMLPVCAIYLRKKDEAYSELFLYDNSERLKLMESLPMSIALHVDFFFQSFQNICTSILQYFSKAGSGIQVSM